MTAAKRYTAEHNGLAGTHNEQFGWQVIDSQPHSIASSPVAASATCSAGRGA